MSRPTRSTPSPYLPPTKNPASLMSGKTRKAFDFTKKASPPLFSSINTLIALFASLSMTAFVSARVNVVNIVSNESSCLNVFIIILLLC